jgi:acyl-CoA thioesterase I
MRYFFFLAVALAICGCSHPHETGARDTADDSRPTSTSVPTKTPDATPDNRKVLVVFGDSISAGFGLPAGQSFPDYMQKELDAEGYRWHVVNLGISGDTTEGGVSRIDSATSLKPSIVVLELGGNDGLRGLPLASTRDNLDQMITAFQKSGARVVLAGMTLPPNYGPDYVHQFEDIYKDLAAQHKVKLIPFLMADIVTKDLRYIQRDGIHPTAPGSEIIAGTVLTAVKPLLQ